MATDQTTRGSAFPLRTTATIVVLLAVGFAGGYTVAGNAPTGQMVSPLTTNGEVPDTAPTEVPEGNATEDPAAPDGPDQDVDDLADTLPESTEPAVETGPDDVELTLADIDAVQQQLCAPAEAVIGPPNTPDPNNPAHEEPIMRFLECLDNKVEFAGILVGAGLSPDDACNAALTSMQRQAVAQIPVYAEALPC